MLLFAAAMLAFAGCKEEEEAPALPAKADSIELSSSEKTFDYQGGKVQIIVASSGEWTMKPAETYDWTRPDITSGVDGDIVKFTVDANSTREVKTAEFLFSCGKAEQSFKIISNPQDLPSIELKSEASNVFGHEAVKDVEIKVYAEGIYYQDFKVAVPEEAKSWLTHVTTLPGDTENDAKIIMDIKALEGLEDRNAVVTVSAVGTLAPVEINFLQEAKHVLSVPAFFTAEMTGETIEVPVTANVEYKIDITSDAGTDWIKHKEKRDGNEYFEVSALETGKRSATVTLTQTDVKEGEEALTASFSVTQQEILIKWAARMDKNRLFPKWEAGGPGDCSEFTWEVLFCSDDFDRPSGGIYTIMGIEGVYLFRFGDVGNPVNRIQHANNYMNYNIPMEFEPGKWYHLAVTFANQTATYYVNGQKVGNPQKLYKNSYNISPEWSYEDGGWWDPVRAFWLGYSYDSNRDFHGLMTEVRVWNRALSEEEINADKHFYEVDPKSDGLYSYWKFTDGEAEYVTDATGKGNHLYGETNVRNQGGTNKGDAGIVLEAVSLPEK